MIGDYYLEKQVNICKADAFYLLPSIYCISGSYFEINISFLIIAIHIAYTIRNYKDD